MKNNDENPADWSSRSHVRRKNVQTENKRKATGKGDESALRFVAAQFKFLQKSKLIDAGNYSSLMFKILLFTKKDRCVANEHDRLDFIL